MAKNPKTIVQEYLRKKNITPIYDIRTIFDVCKNACKFFRGYMLVKRSFIEVLKRFLILVPNAGIYREKKSDHVR